MDTAVTAEGPARQLLPVLAAAVATVAVTVAGLRVSGLGVIDAIGYALVIIWALAGTVVARAADGAAHRGVYWLIMPTACRTWRSATVADVYLATDWPIRNSAATSAARAKASRQAASYRVIRTIWPPSDS